jgi:predicted DNA-binding protein|tara:strand:+ start:448 stop:585 length:138 start_codon:yes stop_codon:yes gene_type:complete
MDITKWKSVLVPIEVYEQIKKIAKSEGRTISGQLRIMWETYKKHK